MAALLLLLLSLLTLLHSSLPSQSLIGLYGAMLCKARDEATRRRQQTLLATGESHIGMMACEGGRTSNAADYLPAVNSGKKNLSKIWVQTAMLQYSLNLTQAHCTTQSPATARYSGKHGPTYCGSSMLPGYVLHPEWPHRQGGCLACSGCTFGSRAEVALIYTMLEVLRGYCP